MIDASATMCRGDWEKGSNSALMGRVRNPGKDLVRCPKASLGSNLPLGMGRDHWHEEGLRPAVRGGGLENVYEQLKVGEMTLSMGLLWGRNWKPEVWMDLRICLK